MANSTTLVGSSLSTAVAADPSLCRVSGNLIDGQGNPLKGWSFTLRYCNSPMGVAPGTIILKEKISVRADSRGYVEFDLLRGATLTAEFPNLLAWLNNEVLVVPDAASVELLAFLFPYIVSVDWEDPGPFSIGVGDGVTVPIVGTLSNGETITLPSSSVVVTSSDEAVLTLVDGFTWRGASAGSATLTVSSVDASSVNPHYTREGDELTFLDLPAPTLPVATVSVTVA